MQTRARDVSLLIGNGYEIATIVYFTRRVHVCIESGLTYASENVYPTSQFASILSAEHSE
jgi:hypothetical protein